MPYIMKLGNILDSTDDAIINSLGIHTNVYGRLCKAIINESKSDELKKYIDNLGKVNILDTFVTKGYNLKPNIIHIVTPFKKHDNGIDLLTQAYEKLINNAIEKGYKSLSIAFIGTGANGYSDVEASNSISLAVDKLLSEEEKQNKDILSVTLYVKPKTREEILNEVHFVERETRFDEYRNSRSDLYTDENISTQLLKHDYVNYLFKERFLYDYKKRLDNDKLRNSDRIILAQLTLSSDNNYNNFPSHLVDNGAKIYYPFDFVDNYINEHFDEWKENNSPKDTTRLNEAGIDRKKRFNLHTQTKINSKDLFSIAFTFGMNKEETIMFMLINGTSFSPLDKYSMFYLEYLNGMYGEINTMDQLASCAWELYKIEFGNMQL